MHTYTQFKGNNPFGSQAKMLFHLDRVQEYLTKGDTTPVFVEFNLTDKCNLRCSWCISENCRDHEYEINVEVAKEFLKDFRTMGGKAVTFSGGGEPTFHPDFVEIAEYASFLGLDLGLMTNGVFSEELIYLIGSRFKWVRISLDTLNPALYRKWKGRNAVDQVIKNVRFLRSHPVKVGINVNVGQEHTVKDVKNTITKLRELVDYIQFRPVLPRYFRSEIGEVNSEVWVFLRDTYGTDDKINLSNDKLADISEGTAFPFKECAGHVFNPIVQANGDVAVCMYHPKDPEFTFGNLYTKRFSKIWWSAKRQSVVENLKKCDYAARCQICCKLTELNKFVEFIKYPSKEMDINFL